MNPTYKCLATFDPTPMPTSPNTAPSTRTTATPLMDVRNSMTNDKSQIYMRFTLIYLVFCIVYHLFWAFLCVFLSCRWCSSRRIEERAKCSKRSQKRQKWAKQESMLRHGFVMPQHEVPQSKTRGWHAASFQGGVKIGF